MNNTAPLVSCIMPTANRYKFVPLAIKYFLDQDYENKELVIVDDGSKSIRELIPEDQTIRYFYLDPLGTIGLKRNYACTVANGEIIMHWDDDDWYAKDWITKQVTSLLASKADLTGLNKVIFYSPSVDQRWMYEDTDEDKPWLCGATLAYRKSFWDQHKFIDLQVGEDYDFVWNSNAKIYAHDYNHGFVAILHAHNTSIKPVENPKHKKIASPWIEPIQEDQK